MDTFTQLPLAIDGTTKTISSTASGTDPLLNAELSALNALHKSLVSTQSEAQNAIPPPPTSVGPKRSAQIEKAKESGNSFFRQGKYADAIRLYSLGIEFSLGRPAWEPAALVRDELALLYANRSQAQMSLQNWPDGAIDAQLSVELKRTNNSKAYWRKGKCLLEMGRVDEADEWLSEAIEFEGQESDLLSLKKEVQSAQERSKQ